MNRSPKTTPYGRKNETIEYWNSKDRIFEWRQHWEMVVNDTFASLQSETRIDCRSFKDQGREDELPTLHMGTAATNMERRAKREIQEGKPEAKVMHSDIGNINRQIKEHNRFIRELKAKMNAMIEAAKDFVGDLAKKLEGIRAKIIGNHYEESVLSHKIRYMESELNPAGARLEKYNMEVTKAGAANETAAKEIKKLEKELSACTPIQFIKKKQLQNQIQELQEQMKNRKDYLRSVARMCGYDSDEEYQELAAAYSAKFKDYQKLEKTVEQIRRDTARLSGKYQSEMNKADLSMAEALLDKREATRTEMEMAIRKELKETYGEDFAEGKFLNAKHNTDETLGIRENRGTIQQLMRDHTRPIKQTDGRKEPDKQETHHHHH